MAMPHSTANWHWKNKNCTSWARSWFQDELVTVSISGEGTEQILVAKVTEVDGDVELGQRKSKLITIYDVKVALEWTGTASDGTDVAGTLTIPEVSHEITVDGLSDYAYEWSLSTGSSPAVDALYSLAKKQLPAALEAKFSIFPKVLLDTHGRDLTVAGHDSAPTSGASTPAAVAAINAGTKNVSVASAAQKVKAINTSDVKTSATFMVEANDFFSLLTDESRIPAWTRAPAKSKAEVGAEYSLFGGGVRGKYVTLEPGKKIVQTWILQSPTWPSGHEATLTTTLAPGSDSTTVTFALAGVPKGMEDEITRNLEGYYIHGFKSIGLGTEL